MAVEQSEHYNIPSQFIYKLGQIWMSSYPGKLSSVFFRAIVAFLTIDRKRARTEFRQITLQAYFTGIEAIPLVALIATLLGSLTITQALTVMPKVGFSDFFGSLMVIVIIRELGPVLTAFLVAGRTGSALAAYVGNMKVESEVDALESMGIDPAKYIVMPAMIGAMIAVTILNTLFSTIAIVVGFLVAKGFVATMQTMLDGKLMWDHYLESILLGLKPMDFVMLLVKPAIFGALIASNACLFGMSVQNDVREVPKATSKSVVYAFISIVIADLILSLVYFIGYMRGISSVI